MGWALGVFDDLVDAALEPRDRSAYIEQIKGLRWIAEPWWPEVSLTPWREGDA